MSGQESSINKPSTPVVHLDQSYPSIPTLPKVGIVLRIYDSNRTDEENSWLTLQALGYFCVFTIISTSAIAWKYLSHDKDE